MPSNSKPIIATLNSRDLKNKTVQTFKWSLEERKYLTADSSVPLATDKIFVHGHLTVCCETEKL